MDIKLENIEAPEECPVKVNTTPDEPLTELVKFELRANTTNFCVARQKPENFELNSINEISKLLQCIFCKMRFPDKTNLMQHILNHPKTTQSSFECNLCKKKFVQKKQWEKHNTRCIKCESCKKTFLYAEDLQRHTLIHAVPKSFTCEICQKKFTTSKQFKSHKQRHAVEYECNVCKKRYNSTSKIELHISIHHNKKRPFKCVLCPKSFPNSKYLRIHTYTHVPKSARRPAPKRLYKCYACNKMIESRYKLKLHLRSHNKKQEKSLEENVPEQASEGEGFDKN